MSFNYYLYRAPDGLGPVNRWERMHAEPLGSAEQVMTMLTDLFPTLTWERSESRNGTVFWSALGRNRVEDEYLDVSLQLDSTGVVLFVVFNKASHSVMRRVMEAMNLNHVSAPEADRLVDPYTDADRYETVTLCLSTVARSDIRGLVELLWSELPDEYRALDFPGEPILSNLDDALASIDRKLASTAPIPLFFPRRGDRSHRLMVGIRFGEVVFWDRPIGTLRVSLPGHDVDLGETLLATLGQPFGALHGLYTPEPSAALLGARLLGSPPDLPANSGTKYQAFLNARLPRYQTATRVPDPLPIEIPYELGWVNYWSGKTCTALAFPSDGDDALVKLSREVSPGAWLVKLTSSPLDLSRKDHVDMIEWAFDRFKRIGPRAA